MRVFEMHRDGRVVADVVEFQSGKVVVAWRIDAGLVKVGVASVAVYDSLAAAQSIHGHEGTRFYNVFGKPDESRGGEDDSGGPTSPPPIDDEWLGRVEVLVGTTRHVWSGPIVAIEQGRPAIDLGEGDPRVDDWKRFRPGPRLTVTLTFEADEMTEKP